MHRLAAKTGTQAYVMPVPFFANTEEDREVLLSQRGVSEVFNLARNADLKLVGIGTVDNQAHLVTSGMLQPNELEEIVALGGVGELLGHFFDGKGRILETSVTARTLAASFSEEGGDRVVAIAGGRSKTEAIRAVLHSHKLHGLITDERTARTLLQSSA
jgi:DNA-binding transcriptional regulator LsrR (DeoR family)